MKKLTLLTTTLSVIAITFIVPVMVQAQGAKTSTSPHRVGLIDMKHIFNNYTKFKDMKASLKQEIDVATKKAKALADQITGIQQKLKSGTLKKDSPEFIQYEQELVKKTSEFKGMQQNLQREFMRKESKVYKEIYLEVSSAVALYAKHYNYTLVMRFDRNSVETEDDAQAVLQKMNRQVVFYEPSTDITMTILDYVNKKYNRTANGSGTTTRQ